MELLHAGDREPRVVVARPPGQVDQLRARVVEVVLARLLLAELGRVELREVRGLLALGTQALLLDVRELRVLLQALVIVRTLQRLLRLRRSTLLRHLSVERAGVDAHDPRLRVLDALQALRLHRAAHGDHALLLGITGPEGARSVHLRVVGVSLSAPVTSKKKLTRAGKTGGGRLASLEGEAVDCGMRSEGWRHLCRAIAHRRRPSWRRPTGSLPQQFPQSRRAMVASASWEDSWPEAEQALQEAAREHAKMLSKERDAAMHAQRRARAAEKALRALPAALQRAQTAEAALRELLAESGSGSVYPPAAAAARG